MGKYKETHGKTRVGEFLKTIKGVAPDLIKLAGDITGVEALENLGKVLKSSDEIPELDKIKALDLLEADIDDRKNARAMQIAALNQKDRFSKRFIYYLAAFWSLAAVTFFFIAGFTTIKNERIVDTILGFVLGTIVSTIITFFYGSSQGSKDKTERLFNK